MSWERKLRRGEGIIPVEQFQNEYADYCLNIFSKLQIVDMPGRPQIGTVSKPWVMDFARAVFGSYDEDQAKRTVQEFFLLIAKKNTKSTTAAALMLTALIVNARDSAEFLILAPTKEVADNAFYPARDMVRANEHLANIFHIQEHTRTIKHRNTGAVLKVVAAENETVSGKKATGILIDELWLFGKKHNADNMLREATGGLASRPEGFVIYLTTQSDDPPAGVFKSKLTYARNVRDGRIDDPMFLPVLYEYPQAMLDKGEHLDPDNFYIPNPNLGASVSEEFLQREFRKAEEDGEGALRGFLAKHLNVEIGIALQSNRWRGADFWEAQKLDSMQTLDALLERSEVCTVGIDGGGLDDLLGLAVIGRDAETLNWLVWTHAWAHPSVLERRKKIEPLLRDFEKAGDLTVVERMGDDVEQVIKIVQQVKQADLLDKVGVDPAGISSILDGLEHIEVTGDQVIGIPQGWKLGGAIKATERKLAEGTLWHCGQPMMAWCVGNARVEPRANSILITKQASGWAKIDPLMATFNAATLMALNPVAAVRKYQMMVM